MAKQDPRQYIRGGKRCAIEINNLDNPSDDWFLATSPRNGDQAPAEGRWEDWVNLAEKILAADEEWRKENKE